MNLKCHWCDRADPTFVCPRFVLSHALDQRGKSSLHGHLVTINIAFRDRLFPISHSVDSGLLNVVSITFVVNTELSVILCPRAQKLSHRCVGAFFTIQ
jgi:hypothetical protein